MDVVAFLLGQMIAKSLLYFAGSGAMSQRLLGARTQRLEDLGGHLDRALLARHGADLHHARRADALDAATEVGKAVDLGGLLDKPASVLTVAGRKRLELARALAIEPRLLLLDEVLAGLNPSEVRGMVPVIRAIASRGTTIVMIEHVMQAVMSLAEHVYVLSEGRIIAEGTPRAIAGDPLVVEAYLGRGAASRMTGELAHV